MIFELAPVKLRQYKNSDAGIVWKLHMEGLKQTKSYIENTGKDEDLKNVVKVYLKNNGEFIVAELDGQVIGMGALKKVSDEIAEIKRMRVDIKYQGQGVGSVILTRLIERAKQLGYKKIILDSTENQKIARHLYEKVGFREYKRGRTKVGDLGLVFYELIL